MTVRITEAARWRLEEDEAFPIKSALGLMPVRKKYRLTIVRKRDGLTYSVLDYAYKTNLVTLKRDGQAGTFLTQYTMHMEMAYKPVWVDK